MNGTNLRADLLAWANVLNRRTGTVPAVDVAWKLRQLAGSTPTTDPAPAPEQTNPAQAESSGTVPQRFPVTDVQTNADPAPAAADGLTRLLWAIALTEERFVSEFGTGPSETRDALHEVMRQANAMAAAPQVPAEPTSDLAGLAAREDAATPEQTKHEVQIREDVDSVRSPGWYIADCDACDWAASGSEPNVEVAAAEHEDRSDADRADNLIPPRPSAPAVDGDTPIPSEEA